MAKRGETPILHSRSSIGILVTSKPVPRTEQRKKNVLRWCIHIFLISTLFLFILHSLWYSITEDTKLLLQNKKVQIHCVVTEMLFFCFVKIFKMADLNYVANNTKILPLSEIKLRWSSPKSVTSLTKLLWPWKSPLKVFPISPLTFRLATGHLTYSALELNFGPGCHWYLSRH
jgi:hypothetical protein